MNNYEYGIHEKGTVSSCGNIYKGKWARGAGKTYSFYSDVCMNLLELKIKQPMQSKGRQPRRVWVKKNFISASHG